MRDATPFRNAIRSACPDLTIEMARLLDSAGQNNDLLLVNEELIFRFPRYAPGVETL
ncbi:MAG: hypothetical protein K0Q72_5237, partial [Armatimonadetes bacterium]|nr:hypothetical protein [Armatimonadota bacterium]